MAKTVKDLLAEANMSVQKLSPAEAAEKIRSGDVMVDAERPSLLSLDLLARGALRLLSHRGLLRLGYVRMALT